MRTETLLVYWAQGGLSPLRYSSSHLLRGVFRVAMASPRTDARGAVADKHTSQ